MYFYFYTFCIYTVYLKLTYAGPVSYKIANIIFKKTSQILPTKQKTTVGTRQIQQRKTDKINKTRVYKLN